jgi:hypothetical protein
MGLSWTDYTPGRDGRRRARKNPTWMAGTRVAAWQRAVARYHHFGGRSVRRGQLFFVWEPWRLFCEPQTSRSLWLVRGSSRGQPCHLCRNGACHVFFCAGHERHSCLLPYRTCEANPIFWAPCLSSFFIKASQRGKSLRKYEGCRGAAYKTSKPLEPRWQSAKERRDRWHGGSEAKCG